MNQYDVKAQNSDRWIRISAESNSDAILRLVSGGRWYVDTAKVELIDVRLVPVPQPENQTILLALLPDGTVQETR